MQRTCAVAIAVCFQPPALFDESQPETQWIMGSFRTQMFKSYLQHKHHPFYRIQHPRDKLPAQICATRRCCSLLKLSWHVLCTDCFEWVFGTPSQNERVCVLAVAPILEMMPMCIPSHRFPCYQQPPCERDPREVNGIAQHEWIKLKKGQELCRMILFVSKCLIRKHWGWWICPSLRAAWLEGQSHIISKEIGQTWRIISPFRWCPGNIYQLLRCQCFDRGVIIATRHLGSFWFMWHFPTVLVGSHW